jgi:hypothetical protein
VVLSLTWLAGDVRGGVCISELLADNENGIADEDGNRQDWLELYNSGEAAVNLDGWWLTDKASNVTQWRIPNVSIPSKGTLLIWASGKNRSNPAAPLHTNFSLSKDGEYLGLYRPDPTNGLPVLVDAFSPKFPALPPDVSYGRMFAQTTTTFVASGEVGRYRVPMSALEYTGTVYSASQMGHGQPGGWNVSPSFNDATWTNAATGIGYDTKGGLEAYIGKEPSGNCKDTLQNINTSLCFRRTFYVPDPSNTVSIKLRMKFEDAFVAFINGVEVGRTNFIGGLAFNSKSGVTLNVADVTTWAEYAVSNRLLVAGTNLLAVQGLNITLGSSDFLLLPEVVGSAPEVSSTPVYFSSPTPNARNGNGTGGPLLCDATPEDPGVPRPLGNASSPPLTVTVRVIKTANNVSAVRAIYGTMWNAESNTVALLDNGVSPDAVGNDGIYTVNLPTTNPAPGQMFRWRFEAQDVQGLVTKMPACVDTNDSPRYFGTVAADSSSALSQLPVLEWFVQGSPSNGPAVDIGYRGCCYYLTNFYDNIGITLHGQSTMGFAKKSYNFDFTSEDRFLWTPGERRVKDVNLLSNYADKTKTRNTLAHWVGKTTGTPYHFAFPVRVHLNGAFHGVLDLVEDGDDRMLERNGLDPDGAFYKIGDTNFLVLVEKKTRQTEGTADLQALYDGLSPTNSLASRHTFTYDNVDVAATVNYLATRLLDSETDHGHKNYYLYRDSNRTREWQPIIWDVDLSQGHNWTSIKNYFDDTLYTNNPFSAGAGSRLYNIVWSSPEMGQMFVRRMRTLMDTLMQPPGTTNGIFETRMREIVSTVDPDPADPSPWTDGDLDVARWGFSTNFIPNRPREEVERVVTNYFVPRRGFLFNKGAGRPTYGTSALSLPFAPQTNAPGMVTIDSIDFLPASGTQSNEYVILRNTTGLAVDISGWQMKGEISYTFKGGTVIPAGAGTAATNYIGLLHLAKDAASFRQRSSGPTGGQRRFVQGNYSGQLSARGGTLSLYDATNQLIATTNYVGTPVPAQRSLRITEIQYHPAAPSGSEAAALIGVAEDDFEFLEFANIETNALTLTGAYFSQGLDYTFPTSSLAGGARLILAKSPAAFALRYASVGLPVYGPYGGALDNSGERLELTDVCGENVLDFEYKDGWYPATDGSGRALVLRDAATAYNAYGDAVTWGISGSPLGRPGETNAALAQAYHGWDNFHFTEVQRGDALLSGPYQDPDGDGRLNWVEYALGSDPWVSDAEPVGFTWVQVADARYAALRFKRPVNALDVTYELLTTGDLVSELWGVSSDLVLETAPLTGSRESVTLRETGAATAAQRFFRLRLTFTE